jgi:peroxiredoxin
MLELGTNAPDFELLDPMTGKNLSLESIQSDQATVIMFICNHCPYVRHVRHELTQLGEDYIPKDVSFVAISSNDVERYPEDAPEKMKEIAEEWDLPFPYLYDATQEVAKAYQAACTPDFYIFDGNMKLVYRGQLDDSRPGNNVPVSGKDIRNALENILAGMPVNKNQKPSIGCNIKWKS